MPELRPGMFTEIFGKALELANERDRKALAIVAAAAERQAKVNALGGTHKLGTPTPAHKGSGPALISGTLRRSITHTPVERDGLGWKSKVGMAGGVFAPYNARTPASLYAYYLETVWDYPFLKPACRFAMQVAGPAIWKSSFGSANWKVL